MAQTDQKIGHELYIPIPSQHRTPAQHHLTREPLLVLIAATAFLAALVTTAVVASPFDGTSVAEVASTRS